MVCVCMCEYADKEQTLWKKCATCWSSELGRMFGTEQRQPPGEDHTSCEMLWFEAPSVP